MTVPASELTQMVKMLTEEDYIAVIKYIEFLISSRKKRPSLLFDKYRKCLLMIKDGLLKKKCYRIWRLFAVRPLIFSPTMLYTYLINRL